MGFERFSICADDDTLLGLSFNDDAGADKGTGTALAKCLHIDRRGVGQFLSELQKNLLPDEFGNEESLGVLGEHVFREIFGSCRQRLLETGIEPFDIVPGPGGNRQDFLNRGFFPDDVDALLRPGGGNQVGFVHRDDARAPHPAQDVTNLPVESGTEVGGVDHTEKYIRVAYRTPYLFAHSFVKAAAGTEQSRRIQKDHLRGT